MHKLLLAQQVFQRLLITWAMQLKLHRVQRVQRLHMPSNFLRRVEVTIELLLSYSWFALCDMLA